MNVRSANLAQGVALATESPLRVLSQTDLLAEMRQTRPLSVLMAEKVTDLRESASDRTVPCD